MNSFQMVQCPKCSAQNPQGSCFCNACGELLGPALQTPAAEGPAVELPKAPVAPRLGLAIASLVLGKDGKTYTLSEKYRDANGQPYQQVEVYEKQ